MWDDILTMTENVLDSIDRIRELACQLNQVTDEANRAVADAIIEELAA